MRARLCQFKVHRNARADIIPEDMGVKGESGITVHNGIHFIYVPAVIDVVTNGNDTGTKNVLKLNRALGFEFSIQSSVYGATTVAKVSLFSTWTRCTVSFYSM